MLRRFSEFYSLQGALGRRALTERAKGMLMERHTLNERDAFELLRYHSRRSGRKLIDVAEAVCTSHLLLAALPDPGSHEGQHPRLIAEGPPAISPTSTARKHVLVSARTARIAP